MAKVRITGLPQTSSDVRTTLQPVPREYSNLEAEKGERVVGDINNDGIPESFKVGGKRHSEGGTPLQLNDGAFIFSDTPKMKIKDPELLRAFMKTGKKGVTPAKIADQYDINKYRKQLQDPTADALEKKTAEQMISNYNLKLGQLALTQESMKGFPQGLPEIVMPYLQSTGINPADILGSPEAQAPMEQAQAKYGAEVISKLKMQKGGGMYKDIKKIPGFDQLESIREDYPEVFAEYVKAFDTHDSAKLAHVSDFITKVKEEETNPLNIILPWTDRSKLSNLSRIASRKSEEILHTKRDIEQEKKAAANQKDYHDRMRRVINGADNALASTNDNIEKYTIRKDKEDLKKRESINKWGLDLMGHTSESANKLNELEKKYRVSISKTTPVKPKTTPTKVDVSSLSDEELDRLIAESEK